MGKLKKNYENSYLRNDTLNSIRYSGMSLKYHFLILPNLGYNFRNILNIETKSLCLNWINPYNSKRLNVIWKLHKNGFSNREICDYLILNGFKRRNKKDNYTVKDVFMCIKKLKIREMRKSQIKSDLGLWELWLDWNGG